MRFPKKQSSTRLISFGDWGMSLEGDLSLEHLKRKVAKTDAILFLGDIAYNLNYYKGRKGNDFLEYMRPVSSAVPFMFSVGNHEKANRFEQYKKRFFMPNHLKTKNLYYSYDVNNIHIVSMNSEIFFNKKAFSKAYRNTVLAWLEKDLRKTKQPWKIVYMHRPYYCSMETRKKRCTKQAGKMRKYMEKIIKQNKVDLFLTGHNHYYERTLPVYNMKVDRKSLSKNDSVYTNPKYPSYVTCGISGTDAFMPKSSIKPKFFSKNVSITVGLCAIKVKKNKLKFKFVNSKDSTIMDKFKIVKK